MGRSEEQTDWVNHTFEVERHAGAIRLALEELRSARRGELLGLQGSSGASYAQAWAHPMAEIDTVARLTRDNPRQQAQLAEMHRRAQTLDRLMRSSGHGGVAGTAIGEPVRQQAAQAVEESAERVLSLEQGLLRVRIAKQGELVAIFYLVLAVAGTLLLGVAFASIMVILRYTRDLTRTRDDLRTLNANLESLVGERTQDLQRANDEIQRFAYIVSHDLRAPLVNVMGFTAELEASLKSLEGLLDEVERDTPALVGAGTGAEARDAVRLDLPEAIGFIRTSTHKMDRLINAILRLSREGRRTITPEPVMLAPLLVGVVDGIRHLVDERGAQVTIAQPMPTIVSDRLALEQILSNLIENALKYLSPARPGDIRISARQERGRTVIAVADNGRGIDPRDHERVFELFRRSGAQDQPGEGIGLAHVRALAYRLGGTIRVESALDQGATFLVDLPNQFSSEKDAVT
ncbi:MAG: CHASE3 domain-containing protein [Sphingomonadales bacterium]|nr:CHASE3 domain-containing protein [Sphingomonadales bacterium]